MFNQDSGNTPLSLPSSPKVVGLVTGSIGVLEIVLATFAYAAVRLRLDFLATYLSDIGAAPVWAQAPRSECVAFQDVVNSGGLSGDVANLSAMKIPIVYPGRRRPFLLEWQSEGPAPGHRVSCQ